MNLRERHFTLAVILLAGCLAFAGGGGANAQGGVAMPLELKSPDFSSGASIAKQFTCDGADMSPALAWNDPPAATQSFALIADDPDAPVGTWVHWVLFDLPANARSLSQNIPKQEQLTDGARQGQNDFRRIGYGGPCPHPKPRSFTRLSLFSPASLPSSCPRGYRPWVGCSRN
jgi:Raf kinase inhibitor-like YbhB/YbcL family protein